MRKFELIRNIFNIVMREGFDDNKQDAISEYTKDKMENIVYVKKLNVENIKGIESVAITSMEYDFGDTCDSDLRVATYDMNIGRRVIVYANELTYAQLESIFDYLSVKYSATIEEKCYNTIIKNVNEQTVSGPNVSVNRQALQYVLALFRKIYIDKN